MSEFFFHSENTNTDVDASEMIQFMAKMDSKLKLPILADFSGFNLDGNGQTLGRMDGRTDSPS